MKTVVAIYSSHHEAVEAVKELQKSGYGAHQLSIIGKADLVNHHVHLQGNDNVEKGVLSIGSAAGTVLGILTSAGVLAIPGFGILYGAGALLGGMIGLEGGFAISGLVVILTTMLGVDEIIASNYEQHLMQGKFLVFAQGDENTIIHAPQMHHAEGISFEVSAN